jgi:hypothetical protein
MAEHIDVDVKLAAGGKVAVVAINGKVRFADQCSPGSAVSRTRLLANLDKAIAGVALADVEQRILDLAVVPPPASTPHNAEERDPQQDGDDELTKMPADVVESARAMLRSPDLIRTILLDVERMGVVGEQQSALTVYLLATSRLLQKPFSGILQGVTSTGKSFVPDRISELIPPEAKILATSMTPNALFYMPDGGLRHRVVFAGERSRVEDDERAEATRPLREMLESGWLRKALPIKGDDGKFVTHLIEQQGPIAYLESTTLGTIFDEDKNRCLLLASDDSAAQTRRILDAVGQRYANPISSTETSEIVARHHAAQRLLRRVVVRIPFAPAIAASMPTDRPESRRAISQCMGVVQAIALLRQFQRCQKPEHGAVVDAVIEDYVIARAMLLEPLGRSLGGTLPGGVQSFWDWVTTAVGPAEMFTAGDLLSKTGCRWQQSTTYDYVKLLRGAGHLLLAGQEGKANLYRLAAVQEGG